MADGSNKGLVSAGAGLVWRRKRVLWWVFAVNLVLGGLGAAGAARILSGAIGNSLAGNQLVDRFDLGMFVELLSRPEVGLMRAGGGAVTFAILFALFMLFVSGGILEVYRQDRKLTSEEFFAASGGFFWRFFRLMLLSLIPFGILQALNGGVQAMADKIGEQAVSDATGFYIQVVGGFIILLLMLFVRLWFDIAQVRAVVQRERGMWRNMWKSLGITRRQKLPLFWMYFKISLFAWICLLLAAWLWTMIPPRAIWLTFLLLELLMLTQLATRLWQKASAVLWYQRHAEVVPADAVDYTTPAPQEIVEPLPPTTAPGAPEPNPNPGLAPDGGLPPQDA